MPHQQKARQILGEKLRVAASKGNIDNVAQLLESGVECNTDAEGRTAIHYAAYYGHIEIVNALISAGYDVNVPDFYGYTALQRAAAEGHVDVVRQLIKHGGNVDSQDDIHGNTGLHEAAWKGFSRMVEVLCRAKSNVYLKNKGGFLPLHLACQNGHNQSCRALLIFGCKPDVKNNYGDTPLHTAARYGHAGVVRILLSAGCNVNEQNKNGDTALHIATAMGRRKLTRILIDAGCDINLENKQREIPFALAFRKGHLEVCDILKSHKDQRQKLNVNNRREHSSGTPEQNGARDEHRRQEKKKGKSKHEYKEGSHGISKSPYGCHHPTTAKDFKDLNLYSLPKEPLKKGEQYYVDLAGNIKKGPIGMGYTCYCAPFFKKIEKKMENYKQELKEHIDGACEDLNTKINHLEKKTKVHLLELNKGLKEHIAYETAECMGKIEQAVKENIRHQGEPEISNGIDSLMLEPNKVSNKRLEMGLINGNRLYKSEDGLDQYRGPSSGPSVDDGSPEPVGKLKSNSRERDLRYTANLHSSFESQSTNGLPIIHPNQVAYSYNYYVPPKDKTSREVYFVDDGVYLQNSSLV
ncbi:hypothetical protein CHUAL_012961 [Chamberlinius hualienensis]